MTETFVAHDGTRFVCYSTSNGVDRRYLGCHHATPREAIDHITREEDTDALHPDRAGVALVGGTSRSAPERPTLPDSGGDCVPTPNETPGQPVPPDGSRRPAPTGTFPPGPVGAPSPHEHHFIGVNGALVGDEVRDIEVCWCGEVRL